MENIIKLTKELLKTIELFDLDMPDAEAVVLYGSAIAPQEGYEDLNPDIDILRIRYKKRIKDAFLDDIEKNPQKYGWLSKLYFKYATNAQIRGYTGVAYRSGERQNGRMAKYGMAELEHLEYLALNGKTYYVIARLSKVIHIYRCDEEIRPRLEALIQKCRDYTMAMALFLTPDGSSLEDLYTNAIGLSFIGDSRMDVAENPDKVKNTVDKQLEFLKIIWGTSNKYFSTDEFGNIHKHKNDKDEYLLMEDKDIILPYFMRAYLEHKCKDINDYDEITKWIRQYFFVRNVNESVRMTSKGLFLTVGLVKSIEYVMPKVQKKLNPITKKIQLKVDKVLPSPKQDEIDPENINIYQKRIKVLSLVAPLLTVLGISIIHFMPIISLVLSPVIYGGLAIGIIKYAQPLSKRKKVLSGGSIVLISLILLILKIFFNTDITKGIVDLLGFLSISQAVEMIRHIIIDNKKLKIAKQNISASERQKISVRTRQTHQSRRSVMFQPVRPMGERSVLGNTHTNGRRRVMRKEDGQK